MAESRTLACIGLHGLEFVQFGLALDEACERLGVRWVLSSPDRADLLLLAEGSPEADAAGLTAAGRGVHCVRIRPGAEPGIDTLPSGFEAKDLMLVLAAASRHVSDFRSIDAFAPEFFESIETSVPQAAGTADAGHDATVSRRGDPAGVAPPDAIGLDHLLQHQSGAYALHRVVPTVLSGDTGIDPVRRAQPSSRADLRGDARNPYAAHARGAASQGSLRDDPAASPVHAARSRTLGDFLRGDALVAPCRLQVEGAEPLTLDPKNRAYMIAGDLAAAEPYATGQYVESDFRRLTTRELERARGQCEPLPYPRLQWLVALRRSDGWLPRHFDPGGSYRVRHMLDLDEHFDAQIRIASVLQDWSRLHEVASQAGVNMQMVYHCVTAYDAIGWLERRPRARGR